ncbi:hypothetical protein [Sphingomonas rubra]|uniref:Inner membrane protein n=1 Tax=Sphingomonas rubra TaxID=634430 RepID=A0A1I5TTR9_9SPHN|nr:hypothetical protein [Sphingomonas rubra]SFP86378.1 hypothetical protein SAMN04488241_10945 [Sphingomonas rubra]
MSSHAPADVPSPRGRRWGLVLALLLLAFVVGGLFAGYALTTGLIAGRTAAKEAARPVATGFTPAQPLGPGGAPPAVDPATLVTREAALAAQLAALEARAATISTDAAAAGAQATRAEALMVAFAARRAIDRGTPLGYLEEQLRSRFVAAQPRAVAVVIAAARNPVTVEDLRQSLDTLAPQLQSGDGHDWLAAFRRELGTLVVLRRENTPTTAPVDRLARARRLLDDGQVAAARAEVAKLPGAAQASGWIAAARRYTLVHQALDVIETAAILGQAQGPQPVPPAPVTTAPLTTAPAAPVAPPTQTETIS